MNFNVKEDVKFKETQLLLNVKWSDNKIETDLSKFIWLLIVTETLFNKRSWLSSKFLSGKFIVKAPYILSVGSLVS